jgi:hypothetical protein
MDLNLSCLRDAAGGASEGATGWQGACDLDSLSDCLPRVLPLFCIALLMVAALNLRRFLSAAYVLLETALSAPACHFVRDIGD